MIRRCPAPLTMLVAALAFSLGSRPISTQAAAVTTSTATYTLTSSTGLPVPGASIAGPQVEALVSPTGGVVPPAAVNGVVPSPMTILSGSSGFDPSQLVVALKDTTSSSGQPEQLFGLVFFGQGLAAGGVLNFSLTTESSLSTPPVLQSQTAGVSITLDSVSSSTSGSGSSPTPDAGGGGPTVPEPLSLLIWSALACAGLLRVRAQRRSQRVAL